MAIELSRFIDKIFLFKGLSKKNLDSVFSEIKFSICNFQKGDTVFSNENCRKAVGFIMSGECEVGRERAECEFIPLNNLREYSSFGILSIFSNEMEYPTVIKAVKPTQVFFIDGDDMLYLVKNHSAIAMNVMTFLAGRVAFLNKKIETFSGKSTAEKLASYLLSKFKEFGSEITISRTRISAEIGVGRASLYRDLDNFEINGLIKTDQKKIIIICPEGLERILK